MHSYDSGDRLSQSMMKKLLDESKFGGKKRRDTAPAAVGGERSPPNINQDAVYVDGQELKIDENDNDAAKLRIGTTELSNNDNQPLDTGTGVSINTTLISP